MRVMCSQNASTRKPRRHCSRDFGVRPGGKLAQCDNDRIRTLGKRVI